MRLELIDSLTLPGDPSKPNEDAFAHGGAFAVVFDGATGLGERLMPGPSDAQWIAQFAARRLRSHALEGKGAARDWLRATAAETEKSYLALRRRGPVEQYEIAFASMMMVALKNETLDVLWFGDCALLVEEGGRVTMLGETLERRAKERDRAAALSKARGLPAAAAGVREEFLPAIRASRNKVNTATNEWLFAPDAACADHAAETHLPVSSGTHLLLASDGFLTLVSDYGRYDAQRLVTVALERGLSPLGHELREVEAGDPDGQHYPRLKRSDDATALLLRIAD